MPLLQNDSTSSNYYRILKNNVRRVKVKTGKYVLKFSATEVIS